MRVRNNSDQAGFTLIEILIAIGILAVITSIALVGYRGYIETTRINAAINQITEMSIAIADYGLDNADFPASLDAIGPGNILDPWGNPYCYLNFANVKGKGKMRKDRFLVPLNTDYDLYSMGKDGKTATPLNAKISYDDVVRANDGGFIGLGKDY